VVYEKLRSFPRLGGKVAVSVAGGACGGCKMIIPTILTSRLHRTPPDQTVQCVHCQRILVS
jgi:predicted  nucleic acid-binding Zn-ribbon protein